MHGHGDSLVVKTPLTRRPEFEYLDMTFFLLSLYDSRRC